jgi:hypothetical protein
MNNIITCSCGAKYNSNTVANCPICKSKVNEELLNILNNQKTVRRTKREIRFTNEQQELINNKFNLHNLLFKITERKNLLAKFNNNNKYDLNDLFTNDFVINNLYKQADNIAKKLSTANHLTNN